MATYNADILLNVKSSKAESAVKKIEQGQKNIAIASNKILRQDTRIVAERRKLLGLDGKSASLQRQKIRYLSQQKAELVLQKRQLSEIVALEKQSNKSRRSRGSGLGGALAGAGVGAGLTKSFFDASELQNADARVKILGQTYNQLAGIQEAATRSSEKFLISNVDAIKAYVDLGNRLGSQGATIADIENIYEGLNTVLVTNKATAQEAASATLQLNQALGAGKLAGEEYKAINEATPQVITEVAKVLGVARGEVKKLASEGAVNSQVLLQALTNLRKEGADGLKEGLSGAFAAQREFTKALKEFSQVVGTELLPVITPLLKKLSELLKLFGQLPGPIKQVAIGIAAVGAVAGPAAIAIGGLGKALAFISGAGLLAAAPWLALAAGIGAAAFALNNYQLTAKGASTADNLKRRGAELLKIDKALAAAEARRDKQTDERARKSDQQAVDNFQDMRQRKLAEIRKIREGLPINNKQTPQFELPKTEPFKIGDVVGGAPTGKGKADKAAERLAALRIEINLAETNANFKSKITAAEIAGNKELVIRLENLKDIANIQANEQKALVGIDDARERALIKQKTAAEINAANVEAAAQLALIENQRQQAFDKQIESLNFEYSILTATTIEERKRLQIAQQMAALKGQDFTPEQLDQIKAAKERLDIGPIQTYVNELQLSLSDTESMVVSLAQSVENSLATAMSSAVETLITGTGSVQEAFSDMFANIGKAFIDMATQMLAQKAFTVAILEALNSGASGIGGVDAWR